MNVMWFTYYHVLSYHHYLHTSGTEPIWKYSHDSAAK